MNLAPGTDLGPIASRLVVDGLFTVAFGLWTLVLVLRAALAWRRAHVVASAVADPERLREGPALVSGRVALAPGETSAPVRVTLTQAGHTETTQGASVTTWREVKRATTARPFYLELADGSRVRVEPDPSPELVAPLGPPRFGDNTWTREREASLTPGAPAWVEGRLSRDHDPHARRSGAHYRDAAAPTLVLRPDGGRMFVSAEPAGDRFAREARRHLTYAVVALAAQVVGQLYALDAYRALRDAGAAVTLPATVGHRGQMHARGEPCARVVVGARSYDLGVSREGLEQVGRTGEIRVLVSRGHEAFVQAGEEPRVSKALAGGLALAALAIVGAYVTGPWSRREAWHERRWFIEQEPGPMMYAVTRPPKG